MYVAKYRDNFFIYIYAMISEDKNANKIIFFLDICGHIDLRYNTVCQIYYASLFDTYLRPVEFALILYERYRLNTSENTALSVVH